MTARTSKSSTARRPRGVNGNCTIGKLLRMMERDYDLPRGLLAAIHPRGSSRGRRVRSDARVKALRAQWMED